MVTDALERSANSVGQYQDEDIISGALGTAYAGKDMQHSSLAMTK